jgi:hypothetical protein
LINVSLPSDNDLYARQRRAIKLRDIDGYRSLSAAIRFAGAWLSGLA